MVCSIVIPLFVVAAYMIGAIPFGVMIARLRGVDIRAHGSGNIGATNVARVMGLPLGLLVLALDAGKGAAAVLIVRYYIGVPQVVALAGWAAIAGHCFSPFLGGEGGKGVATSLGVFAMISPPLALVGIAVFLLVAGRTRIPALGSLAGAAAVNVYAMATHAHPASRMLALATFLLLLYTHRDNLARLTK